MKTSTASLSVLRPLIRTIKWRLNHLEGIPFHLLRNVWVPSIRNLHTDTAPLKSILSKRRMEPTNTSRPTEINKEKPICTLIWKRVNTFWLPMSNGTKITEAETLFWQATAHPKFRLKIWKNKKTSIGRVSIEMPLNRSTMNKIWMTWGRGRILRPSLSLKKPKNWKRKPKMKVRTRMKKGVKKEVMQMLRIMNIEEPEIAFKVVTNRLEFQFRK